MARDGYAGERQEIQPKAAAHDENRTGVSPEHADRENEISAGSAGLRDAPTGKEPTAGTASAEEIADADDERAGPQGPGGTVAGATAGAVVGAVVGAAVAATEHPAFGHEPSAESTDGGSTVTGAATASLVGPQAATGSPPRSTRDGTGGTGAGGNTAPGRSPSPSGGGAPSGARGPSREVPSNPGPSGGRALGIGAAAGLGTAASAGLLAGGHGQHGGVTGRNPAAHHPTGPLVPPTSSGGDQGFTPVSATDSTTTGAAADSATVAPDPRTSQPVDPIQPAGGHSSPTKIHPGVVSPTTGQASSAAATMGHPVSSGAVPAQDHSATSATGPVPHRQSGTTGQVPGGSPSVPQSLLGAPVYDSSGHPIGTINDQGRFVPLSDSASAPAHSVGTERQGRAEGTPSRGHSGGASAPVHSDVSTPPVLYDSSGHPIAITDRSGHVIALSQTTGQAPRTASVVRQSAPAVVPRPEGSAGETVGSRPPAGNSSSSGVPESYAPAGPSTASPGEWQQVQLTDDQIPPYLLSQSPADRQQEIIDTLAKNKMDLPGGAKEWATLPPEFWNNLKAHYQLTYNDGHGDQNLTLNALGAAAVATYLLTEHPALHVEIDHLNDAAKGLHGEADIVSGQAPPLKTAFDGLNSMWSVLFDYAGDSADKTVQQARANAAQARSYLLGGNTANYNAKNDGKTDGSIANIANALKGAANSLSNAAKGYQNAERANAKQLGLNL